jgi:hypothetical protein
MADRLSVAFVAVLTAACGGGGSSPTAAPEPAPTPTPVASATVLRSTVFAGANGYTTMGQAAIVREGAGHRLELREDFRPASRPPSTCASAGRPAARATT